MDCRLSPRSSVHCDLQAAEHTAAGQAGSARRLLQRVLELRPREPSACLVLGQVLSSFPGDCHVHQLFFGQHCRDLCLEGVVGLEWHARQTECGPDEVAM